jgi:hypothetical protein
VQLNSDTSRFELVILRAAKIAIADEHTMAAELDKPAPANVFFFCHPVLHPDKSFGYLNLKLSFLT